ncbi:hypothetical protein HispidOSU_020850, partial [Sigmodon hispidus]
LHVNFVLAPDFPDLCWNEVCYHKVRKSCWEDMGADRYYDYREMCSVNLCGMDTAWQVYALVALQVKDRCSLLKASEPDMDVTDANTLSDPPG